MRPGESLFVPAADWGGVWYSQERTMRQDAPCAAQFLDLYIDVNIIHESWNELFSGGCMSLVENFCISLSPGSRALYLLPGLHLGGKFKALHPSASHTWPPMHRQSLKWNGCHRVFLWLPKDFRHLFPSRMCSRNIQQVLIYPWPISLPYSYWAPSTTDLLQYRYGA